MLEIVFEGFFGDLLLVIVWILGDGTHFWSLVCSDGKFEFVALSLKNRSCRDASLYLYNCPAPLWVEILLETFLLHQTSVEIAKSFIF